MEIIQKDKIITKIEEKSGEVRHYFLFDTFELIITELPPEYAQHPHYHKETIELYYVIDGTMIAQEGDKEVELSRGEVVCFKPSNQFHSIKNPKKNKLIIATFKAPLLSNSYRKVFQRDKFIKKIFPK
jgi:mannose-6-phosphate isomerase-like protein (cupin superfamily)